MLILVSNPLRLEGDPRSATDWRNGSLWFLIHYGWRGTAENCEVNALYQKFLIHYGWRGTRPKPLFVAYTSMVSNPLRLEGDRNGTARGH